MTATAALAETLALIVKHDTDYGRRYDLILRAMHLAREARIPAGMAYDPACDEGYRVVVYIELPGGRQLSWHMPEHSRPWDRHTTPEKHARIRAWIASVTR